MQHIRHSKKAMNRTGRRAARRAGALQNAIEILENRQMLSGAPASGNIATAAAAYTTYHGAYFPYNINSSPVITAIVSQPTTVNGVSFSSWSFLIQDTSTAAGAVNDAALVYSVPATDITGGTPAVGDTVNVSGAFFLSNNSLPEINGNAESSTSVAITATGATVPAVMSTSISSLASNSGFNKYNVSGQLVSLSNVAISGAPASQATFYTTSFSATLDDSTGATMHLDYNSAYSGQTGANYGGSSTTPATGQDIIGFTDFYNGETEIYPLSIKPDAASTPVETFTATYNSSGSGVGFANVSAGSNSVLVTVTRNVTTDSATLNYTPTSLPHYDTAVAGTDYIATPGTVTFPAGTATETFSVALPQRAQPTGNGSRFFTIEYSGSTSSGALAAASNTHVTISDTRPYNTNIVGAEALANGTSDVTINSNPVITAITNEPGTFQGKTSSTWQFIIQDATGSTIVYASSLPSGYTPTVGDTISISGTMGAYHDFPEFQNVTAISKTGTATVPAPLALNVATILQGANGPANSVTGEDPDLNNPQVLGYYVTVTGYYNANGGAYAAGASTWGTSTSSASPIATFTDSTGTMQFYYWPTSNNVDIINLYGHAVPASTTLTTWVGFVSYYPGSLYPEFTPLNTVGQNADVYTVSTSAVVPSVNTDADQFAQVNRGQAVTVTVSRSENVSSGSISYTEMNDSATAGTDYTAASGTLTFAAGGPLTETFQVQTAANPGDHGDKLFTIVVSDPLDQPATSFTGSVVDGINTIQITDTTSGQSNQAVQSSASVALSNQTTNANTYYENATVQPNGVYTSIATGAAATTDDGLVKLQVNGTEVYNHGGGFGYQYTEYGTPSYSVVTYNDSNVDSQHVFNQASIKSLDGIEFEAVADTQSYDTAGYLNVYIVTNASSGALQANGSAGVTSPLSYDTSGNDPINGGLGTEFLLGTIFYNPVVDDTAGASYVPYNLTALNPAGVSVLAQAVENGSAFRIAIAPGTVLAPVTDPVTHVAETDLTVGSIDDHVAATFEGDAFEQVTINGITANEYVGPILRLEYGDATTVPTWVSNEAGEAPNGVYIVPTQTLAVTQWLSVNQSTIYTTDDSSYLNVSSGTAVIDADPAQYNALPNVTLTSGATLEVAPDGFGTPTTDIAFDGGPLVHLDGLTITGDSTVNVASVGTSRVALVVGSSTSSTAPTFSISQGDGSELNLQDNDLIVHNGNLAAVTSEVISGYDNGVWNGAGITSSAAQANLLTTLATVSAGSLPFAGNTFDGEPVSSSDVIVKYTYYGDANLDGQVDGSDYSRTDNGFASGLTGWQNGDYNYDGVVNGSDYTLIDNAFNRQSSPLAQLAATVAATPAAQVAANAVPPSYSSVVSSTSVEEQKKHAADWLKSFSQQKIWF